MNFLFDMETGLRLALRLDGDYVCHETVFLVLIFGRVINDMSQTPKYLIVDDCPCPYEVAGQVHMVLRRAGQIASSIYRGSDAKALLHAHGKMDQAEIHIAFPSISNPEGESEHDLHSDGVGNTGPVGRRLASWQVGVDSGTNDQASKNKITNAAKSYGWLVKHPYSRGVEGHHWVFASPPRPRNTWQRIRIAYWRRILPRK